MSYYDTNTEIANTFNVSKTTVSRWLEGSIEGRNNLIVEKRDKKVYVLKNEHNYAEMLKLKEEGLKYKASTSYVEVTPKDEFYKVFSDSQQIEIINTLKNRKEVALKFTYMNGGAKMWDEYCTEGMITGTYTTPLKLSILLRESFNYLMYKTESASKVNIIDVGPGNVTPMREFLQKCIDIGKLESYTAVDISEELANIALKNVREWFPDIKADEYIYDIEKVNLLDILFKQKSENNVNILFFAGSTIGSVDDRHKVLRHLRESLDDQDLLVISNKITLENNKTEINHVKDNDQQLLWIMNLLNFDTANCELVGKYDEKLESRVVAMKLDRDYLIDFNLNGTHKHVELEKGDEIILWRHHTSTAEELFSDINKADLQIIQLTTEKNLSHILAVCQAANN